jgi:hypothetical protein
MNEKLPIFDLFALTETRTPHGNVLGKEVYRKLVDLIDARPKCRIFGISLKNIEVSDASFPRESVVSVAKHYRESHGFFLVDVKTRDMVDNWQYGADAKDQPLIIWYPKGEYEIIGPEMNAATRHLVGYVIDKGKVSTSQAAQDLDMSVQNASTRLKKLFSQGYILRTEAVSETGGIEYLYEAIKYSH